MSRSWNLARKVVGQENGQGSPSTKGPKEESSTLEGAEPELCVSLLQRGLNILAVKSRIRSADQQWIEGFLEHDGLSAIFDALEVVGSRGFSSLTDALRQLECVGCIKAVMNNVFGLEFIIHYPEKKYLRKLSQGTCMERAGITVILHDPYYPQSWTPTTDL